MNWIDIVSLVVGIAMIMVAILNWQWANKLATKARVAEGYMAQGMDEKEAMRKAGILEDN